MKKNILIYIDKNIRRIDNFLISKYTNIKKIYIMIRKGFILVNKKKIKPKYKLKYFDKIYIPIFINKKKKNIFKINIKKFLNIKILYEDKYLLIINKPNNLIVHNNKFNYGIIEILKILKLKYKFLELIHRLDKNTSGILIIAKNKNTLCLLNEKFYYNNIKKYYLALLKNKWKNNIKKVYTFINKKNIKHNVIKFSQTYFKLIENFKFNSLIKIIPITGRTHQIRIHSKYINNPIIFDNIYGNIKFNLYMKKIKINRLFLHASLIYFKHPNFNKIIKIRAPLDNSLNICLFYLRKYNKYY